ncbi:TonB-dependent receptor plug domain-containing protein [Thermodesulfobacteriota bacterium]
MKILCILSIGVAILLLSFTGSFAATKTDDEEKMRAVKEMFASPYQEEDYYRTDRLLVTATGNLKPVRKAPSVASVITKEDIIEMGAATLDEVLETVPGLHVTPSNFNRLNSSYSIRGVLTKNNPQVLLLKDGIPVTFILHGTRPDTFNMSVANISRIEVVRGPGSAVHGADAFSGTVNIITKDGPEIDGTTGNIRAGSFGTTDTWVQHGGKYLGWDLSFNLDYLRSDGDTDRVVDSDLQTALDAALGTNASLAPAPLETDDRIVDAQLGLIKDEFNIRFWTWQQDEGGIGAGISQIMDPVGYEDSELYLVDVVYNNKDLARDWDFNLRLNYLYFDTETYLKVAPDGAVMPIGADGNIDFVNPVGVTFFPNGVVGAPSAKNHTYSTELTTQYDGLSGHLFRLGAGYKYLKLEASERKNFGPGVLDGANFKPVSDGNLTDVTRTDNVFIKDTDRKVWHVLFQDELVLTPKWELTGGVRYDHYSDFGGTTNPRLALVWETRYDLITKLLYGKAFRPPSFAENYAINNPASLGNPNIDPETIETYELAFDYQPTNTLRTIFNIFYYEIEGLIEYTADAGQPTSTAQNAKDQVGQGCELEAEWEMLDSLRLRGTFAYQRSEDKSTHDPVPDTPELQFYVNIYWNFLKDWSLDTQYYWIGERHRAAGDTRGDIKDNDIVNLALRWKDIFEHFDFTFTVRNLFDENVREPSQSSIPNDYPMEHRAFYGEIRFNY